MKRIDDDVGVTDYHDRKSGDVPLKAWAAWITVLVVVATLYLIFA